MWHEFMIFVEMASSRLGIDACVEKAHKKIVDIRDNET